MSKIPETIAALREAGHDHQADELEGAYERLAEAVGKQAETERMLAGTTTAEEIQKAWPLPTKGTGEVMLHSIIERLFPDGGFDEMTQADLSAVGDAIERVAEAARGVTARLQQLTALLAKAERSLRHG